MAKVIISCAITGGIHTPSMSPYLPITPEQIAKDSIEAAEAGAAIIHLHARDPIDGSPTPDPAVFMRFLPVIKQSTDAVINVTTGGGLNMTLDERLAAPLVAKPEMCSLNMGSMNFNISRAGDRIKDWKFAWEKPYLDNTDNFIFRNTFKDIEGIVERLGKAHGTRFEFECYDIGHLYNLAYCLDRKIVEPPLFVQSIFGITRRHRRGAAQSAVRQGNGGPVVRRCTMSGRCWRRAGTRWRSPPWPGSTAATCGSGWRTACISGRANWRSRTREQVAKITADSGGSESGDRHADRGAGDFAS